MDVREKLVELLDRFVYDDWYSSEEIVDRLIDHGLTAQEWISVSDRLPDKPMKCLVYTKRGEYGGYEITYYNEGFYLQYSNVNHWMPLPKPPKGE